MIEWYDFVVFGTVSVLVFGKVFYPEQTPFIALLSSLGTFAIGFLARPLGGIFFGYLGDRIGRRNTLMVTLALMGVATLLIGLLPGYHAIGVAAPALLILLRLVQGFSLGGEFGGVATLLIEHAPKDRRGAVGGWAQAGGFVGPLLGTVVILILRSALSDAELVSWGWRVPFLLSVLLIVVAAYIRTHITESPEFERARAHKELSKHPLRGVIAEYPKEIFCVFGMHAGNALLFYTGLTFAVAYITRNVGLSQTVALWANAVFLLAATISCIVVSRLSDRTGRKPIYLAGTILGMVMAFPLFYMLDTANVGIVLLAAAIMGAIEGGFLYGIQPSYFGELFPTKFRYLGMSLGYQAATVLVGATAPMIGVLLTEWSGGHPWAFSLYLIAILVLAAVSVLLAGETRHRDIERIEDQRGDSSLTEPRGAV
ncbi:MFS transporter [Bradyrhizobium sp. NP1]|uniref:MFS transporter n=1 Tax=Bradyrhizobium sp. NP1 TaxID=3049772 RepID=UPI0025A4D4EA|nr:MFS transporter [Bradyrhizobium sp. NP1]WJR75706.1 MFS transporter [Bradyrhizobium sp. NP1]